MRIRLLPAALVLVVAVVLPASRASASDFAVDVELVLAVDVSRSMTLRELEIQRRGYAAALASREVVEAIETGGYGRIALTYVEWAGTALQNVVIDWTLIAGRTDAEAFAARLTASAPTSMQRTSISGALDFAVRRFDGNGYDGLRRVIDVSGDGPNNQGRPVTRARDDAVAQGIVINGLPLMTREGLGTQWHLDDLDIYYRECVIGGPTAFMLPVVEWEHFQQAVRNKLVLELAGWPVPDPPAALLPASESGYDCLIGEKIWDNLYGDWN
ncbi:DUF1194 domain-containing protein [Limibaculum sp. M0105]|uniref:DUF1194 domain-containing protein n=1 Tax=Thermohalobaculum xanthum TaxID=2753746 RepID=A0A8J7M581_9RHOB|nr:DUF1194 domain-containing protein [Thermohalobaculum xanthum]MBK0398644.1 DUF1194 domain-containing protein [Thermohalobaculum xanthum]